MTKKSLPQWEPTPEQRDHANRLVRDSLVIDIHTHPQGIMPRIVRKAAEKLVALPHDPLNNLRPAGVDYAVVTAVGDFIGTIWRLESAWRAVQTQLDNAVKESEAAGVRLTTTASAPAAAPQVILGVEGCDFLGHDLGGFERLHQRGVRVLGLVHYADNRIGTIGTSLTGRRDSGSKRSGLTDFGGEVVRELNRLGIVPDLAHADARTTIAACEESTAPVISSHTAASALRDFPRYISDAEIDAVASTGGVIGLWPASMWGQAMTDLDDFARHASHIAELVGTEHLAIGTDKNGVPDYADGYSASPDIVNLAAALVKFGFSDTDVVAILGGNARRVLAAS